MRDRFSEAIIAEDNFRDQQAFHVQPEAVYGICQAFLDDVDLNVHYLSDITSVDWLGHEREKGGRFEVIYILRSLTLKHLFMLKAVLPAENPEIASLTPLYDGANWLEREIWDMMGIKFTGHPDLTRILTPDGFEGHPLRRDFPLTWEQPKFSWNKDQPPEVIK